MTAFTEKLDRAAGAALCYGLEVAGAGLVGAGAVSLVLGGPVAVPIALGMASLMAAAGGCEWDPNKPPPGEDKRGRVGGCLEVEVRAEVIWVGNGPNQPANPPLEWRRLDAAIFQGTNEDGDSLYELSGISGNGTPITISGSQVNAKYEPGYFSLNSGPDNPCGRAKELPDIPPFEYTDPEDGCKLIVNWEGMSTDQTGGLNPVFKIEPGSNDLLRADPPAYPVTGDCNFAPVLYTGGPGGPGEPPIITPWDPSWPDDWEGLPPWAELLREIAAGIAGNVISNELANLLETPYPPAKYELFSVCEVDSDGKPEQRLVEVTIPPIKGLQAAISRIDALVPLLQGQKDFKQPICEEKKPEQKGSWVTAQWISEEPSSESTLRLRKLTRWRSLSGRSWSQLVEYFRDFTWNAGPVCVIHKDAWWGVPQVWASSAAEGKRVIRFLAGEAGIDPDAEGKWVVSGSTNPRFGRTGKMVLRSGGGYPWVSSRDGSDMLPFGPVDP